MLARIRLFSALLVALPLLGRAAPARAQGPGTTAASVLQFQAGSRAAALSGAYTAASGDADVLFYNPAGAAGLDAAASLAYQRHVEDIAFGSAAGAYRLGRIVLGLGAAYFDAGEVRVIEPDPSFGGQRGRETGETAGARESAARLAVAVPVGRLSLGAAAGFVSSDLAGVTRSAPIFDLGAQFALPRITLGAAIRNIGGSMTGGDAEDAALPTEARLGATFEVAGAERLGVLVGADLASDLRAGTTTFAAGVEAGLLPQPSRRLSAVARLGMDTEGRGEDGLGALRFGAGLTLDRLAVDYTFQELEFFGAVHRIGARWTRAPR